MSFTDTGREEWSKVVKGANELRRAAKGVVIVGILEAEGAKPHGDDGITVLGLAEVHEFGASIQVRGHTIEIPERSFIRATVDERRAVIQEESAKLSKAILDGRLTAEKALARLGEYVVSLIRQRIEDGIAPPLAASTVKKRVGSGKGEGGDTPLFDTGQLMRSVTYRVQL